MMDRFIGIGPNISKQASLFGDNAKFYESTYEFLNDIQTWSLSRRQFF
jgi:hypothetical protein